jgi:hypothetical protein
MSAALRNRLQTSSLNGGVEVVVADPVLEQVAEDEQHLDIGRGRIGEEHREALRQVRPLLAQVQVGDEAGGSGDGEHSA